MTDWEFRCESKDTVPLPPEYSFAQALNYLNSESNSFYILTRPDGSYIQCGGNSRRCTVEMREVYPDQAYTHYVVGKSEGSAEPSEVQMSAGVVRVQESEVLTKWDAIDLFKAYFAGEPIPPGFTRRETDL